MRREEGSNDPIFLGIQACSADFVQLLLHYRANPRSREAVPTADGGVQGRRITGKRRTALEAAASFPRITRVLLDAILGVSVDPCET